MLTMLLFLDANLQSIIYYYPAILGTVHEMAVEATLSIGASEPEYVILLTPFGGHTHCHHMDLVNR